MLPPEILKLINNREFDPELRDRIIEWSQSQYFVEFVKKNKNKILKKLKTAKKKEDKRDIGIELYIGFIFSETNCQVIYEPATNSHNPDFKISFENKTFYCEVKRLRKVKIKNGMIANKETMYKCGDIICEKIIQTVPDSVNVIYIRIKMHAPNFRDLQCAVNSLFKWKREEPNNFLKKIRKCKINSINEFDKYWKQLSGIIISRPQSQTSMPRIWENPDASRPLDPIIKSKIKEAIGIPFRYD